MKIKNFIKENYKFIILMILIVLFFNVKLPYYIMAQGGTINITDRVVMDNYNKKSKGSLNMLYVSEYEGTPASLCLAKLKSYDIESNKERQISNASVKEINRRKHINNTTRYAVLERAGFKCQACGAKPTKENYEQVVNTFNQEIFDIEHERERSPEKRYGFISEDAPWELVSMNRETVDTYSAVAMCFAAIQVIDKRLHDLETS